MAIVATCHAREAELLCGGASLQKAETLAGSQGERLLLRVASVRRNALHPAHWTNTWSLVTTGGKRACDLTQTSLSARKLLFTDFSLWK